jgi:hypothetical protein
MSLANAPRAARFTRLGPLAFALLTVLIHAACWGRYGLFRDELYFLACGQRLGWGYVDQPPGIALVARFAQTLFGTWVPGLRLLPWLASAGTVYLTGRLAARLGGDGAAATLGAAAAFACSFLLALGHILTMNAFEPLLVLGLAVVLLRLAQGADPRLWLAAGALASAAVLFKYTAAFLCALLLLGLLVSPARKVIWTRWALLGAGLAVLLVLPNLAWQAAHGFPFLELARNGVARKNAPITPIGFALELIKSTNPGVAVLWSCGVAWLLAAPAARSARFIGLAGLAYLLLLMFGKGKAYYATPAIPMLVAAGAAAASQVLRRPTWLHAYAGLVTVSGMVLAPLAIPVLPEAAFVRYLAALGQKPGGTERKQYGALPQHFADMHGWPELTAAVARVYQKLSPAEQRTALVYGDNYGLASAVDVLGPALGLPERLGISGHNQYWIWGVPPGRGDPMLVIGRPGQDCGGAYARAELGEQLEHDPWVMPYEDAHAIVICRGLREPLVRLPERLRHYE